MSLNQRLIAGLLLLVALVTAVAVLTVRELGGAAAHGLAHTATGVAWVSLPAAICSAVGLSMSVLGPLRRASEQARAIGQGNLEQRLEWSADDSLGRIAH